MAVAGDLAGDIDQLPKAKMRLVAGRHPKPIPRRAAIGANVITRDSVLEHHEGSANALSHRRRRVSCRLLLGIVEIIEIDGANSEILPTSGDRMAQERRRE